MPIINSDDQAFPKRVVPSDGTVTLAKLGGDVTQVAKDLIGSTTKTAQRTSLGLGSAAVVDASAFDAAGAATAAVNAHVSSSHVNLLQYNGNPAAGDMAWFNGTNWVLLRAPSGLTKPVLTYVSGTPTWVAIASLLI